MCARGGQAWPRYFLEEFESTYLWASKFPFETRCPERRRDLSSDTGGSMPPPRSMALVLVRPRGCSALAGGREEEAAAAAQASRDGEVGGGVE